MKKKSNIIIGALLIALAVLMLSALVIVRIAVGQLI